MHSCAHSSAAPKKPTSHFWPSASTHSRTQPDTGPASLRDRCPGRRADHARALTDARRANADGGRLPMAVQRRRGPDASPAAIAISWVVVAHQGVEQPPKAWVGGAVSYVVGIVGWQPEKPAQVARC